MFAGRCFGTEGSFHRNSSSKRATTSVDLHRADAVKTQLPGSRRGSEAWWIMLAEIDSWLLQVDKLMALKNVSTKLLVLLAPD